MTKARVVGRTLLGFVLGATLSLVAVSVALAVCCGQRNALDNTVNGWIGDDTPGGQFNWSYGNGVHDLILLEFTEPAHDIVRSQDMDWTYDAAVVLNQISSTRNLEFAIKIANHRYYNGRDEYWTNVPWSKEPEGSSFLEEENEQQTEVEMEMIEPHRIHNDGVYFWDQWFDSERSAINGAPTFRKWLENCDEFWTPWSCDQDDTGWMRKKVLQQ